MISLRALLVVCAMGAVGGFEPAGAHIWIDKGVATGSHSDDDAHEGAAVAMDGDVVVVGAPGLDKPALGLQGPVPNAGGVQIYQRNSGVWGLVQTLFSPEPQTGANFGAAVAIDSGILVVGEPAYTAPDHPEALGNGRALIFTRSPTDTLFTYRRSVTHYGLTLLPDAGRPAFGSSVDIARGGSNRFAVVIGAPGEDVFAAGDEDCNWPAGARADAGAIYISRYSMDAEGEVSGGNAENTWEILNSTSLCAYDFPNVDRINLNEGWANFGQAVAIERDDCPTSQCLDRYYIAAGAPNTGFNLLTGGGYTDWSGVGAAHLFLVSSYTTATSSTDIHREQQYFPSVDDESRYAEFFIGYALGDSRPHTNEHFGTSLDLRIVDGRAELVVGAPRALAPTGYDWIGAVFYFQKDSGDCCLHIASSSFPRDVQANEQFGWSVRFRGDGLVVGAPDRINPAGVQGSVFAYEKASSDTWHSPIELYDSHWRLGLVVAGSEDWIAAGKHSGHGMTWTWQRGWMLQAAEPDHGRIRLIQGLSGISPSVYCPPDCTLEVENGKNLIPAAFADEGFVFRDWDGACNDEESFICHITADSDQYLVANFQINFGNTRNLFLEVAGGNGIIEVESLDGPSLSCPGTCDGIYPAGSFVSAVAPAVEGFEFEGWTGGGCESTAGNACSFQMNTNVTLTANFRPIDGNHMLTVEFWDSGTGSVEISSDDDAHVCTTEDPICSVSRPANTHLELHACAAPGSEFVSWVNACSGAGACELDLDEDKEVTAIFKPSDVLFLNGFEKTTCGTDTP